jgi:hypothetical protein
MAVVDQILQHRRELVIKILDACVLINVQVQEMAECVVVAREAEHVESFIQCLEYLLRAKVGGW